MKTDPNTQYPIPNTQYPIPNTQYLTMFTCNFNTTDFVGGSVIPLVNFSPEKMSWSIYGGPDQATLSAVAPQDTFVDFSYLMRCPVTVSGPDGQPCWWGFVNKVELFLENVVVSLSMDDLFNRVRVTYTNISPDNRIQFSTSTGWSNSDSSRNYYGRKELIIFRKNIDQDAAEAIRETILHATRWPKLNITNRKAEGPVKCVLHCQGWFHALSWRYYSSDFGFAAVYGPGPGSVLVGDGTNLFVAQSWDNPTAIKYKYVFLKGRKQGSPTSNTQVRLHQQGTNTNTPGSIVGYSNTISGSSYSSTRFIWFAYEFNPPVTVPLGRAWLSFDPATSNASNHYDIKLDEAAEDTTHHFRARLYVGAAWTDIPNVTSPGVRPNLYFRAIAAQDTGQQLTDIIADYDQFFNKVEPFTSGVEACPFRNEFNTHLSEVKHLMDMGTVNKRRILARVTPDLNLFFYEQPDPNNIESYMDRFGNFYGHNGVRLPSYRPPIGTWAAYAGQGQLSKPWDKHFFPPSFVLAAEYNLITEKVIVKTTQKPYSEPFTA